MRCVPILVMSFASPLWFSSGCDSHAPSVDDDVASGSVAAAVATEPRTEDALLGTWRQVLLNDAGRRFITEEEFLEWDAKCTFSHDTITWQRGIRRETVLLPYTLDTTKTPLWINWRDGKTEIKGILQIEGDTLQICVGDAGLDRPTDFDPTEEPSDVLLEFRRIEP